MVFPLLRQSAGVMESMKSQTPSTKPGPRPEGGDSEGEITNKSQIPIFNDQNTKPVWNFETGDPPAGWGVQAKRGQFWLL
jgi:hypothetical protein